MESLNALQKLLSTPSFIALIHELLHHENSSVRKKSMQLFNECLEEERHGLTLEEELLFVEMVEEFHLLLSNGLQEKEKQINLQTALLSVDILARNFAKKYPKPFEKKL
jgi:hypothetical protein